MPVYDEKCIKVNVKEFGVVHTNFLDIEMLGEGIHYTCIACISIDSVIKKEKKELSSRVFTRMQVQGGEEKSA